MQIDPLEAVITWLETALTTVSGRVAGKHRYGDGGWSESQTGVSVHLDGGAPDLYAPVANARMEIRVYSNDQVNIVNVWRELVQLCRDNKRFTVITSQGNALIHYVLPETNLSLIFDDKLNMDLGVAFLQSKVAEEVVS
jgi:hypothetical protein